MAEQISAQTQVAGFVSPVFVVIGSRRSGGAPARRSRSADNVYEMPVRPEWSPAVNVFDTGQAFVVIAELAGVGPDSLRIELDAGEDRLTLRGTRSAAGSEASEAVDEEIAAGRFERAISFDQPVDPKGARAICRYGLLELMVPKVPMRTWKSSGPTTGGRSKIGGGDIRTPDRLAAIAV